MISGERGLRKGGQIACKMTGQALAFSKKREGTCEGRGRTRLSEAKLYLCVGFLRGVNGAVLALGTESSNSNHASGVGGIVHNETTKGNAVEMIPSCGSPPITSRGKRQMSEAVCCWGGGGKGHGRGLLSQQAGASKERGEAIENLETTKYV